MFNAFVNINKKQLFILLFISISLIASVSADDYVGADNDDIMRLVQVRDLLAGQGWFDLTQYRLGLNGVEMHWSRLIDLPIAILALFFSTYFSMQFSEFLALALWPMLLGCLLLHVFWEACIRARGRTAGIVAMFMILGLLPILNRFGPGSIDHHNVQLLLIAIIVAMLSDAHFSARRFAVAGVAAGLATAIGAETTPLVASTIVIVAMSWGIYGSRIRSATAAFGLSLAISLAILFPLLVPQSAWLDVTCDSFSFGFIVAGATAGLLLAASAGSFSRCTIVQRFVVLALCALVGLVVILRVAPQCMGSPLADLNPLLVEHWLDLTTEARSFVASWRASPQMQIMYYGVPCFAMLVCFLRVRQGRQRHFHAVTLVTILVAWLVSLIQIRGAAFANLVSIFPLSVLVAELRQQMEDRPGQVGATMRYVLTLVCSVPLFWGLLGIAVSRVDDGKAASEDVSCFSQDQFQAVSTLPAQRILTQGNQGAPLLRFTKHHAFSAPYHRNQDGMLAAIRFEMAKPEEAFRIMKDVDATMIGFCANDPQTRRFSKLAPEGLAARLIRGDVPDWLVPLPGQEGKSLRFYRLEQEEKASDGSSEAPSTLVQ